jgi:hypothetical protein
MTEEKIRLWPWKPMADILFIRNFEGKEMPKLRSIDLLHD